ncbi:uncharacterized protein NECHADRAFT_84146 [Fusarium vanettenii 77-13-4]|uniref:Uncharacterized protein n=1 Tax=Fusarium vanettenii (strain ATCC MYA-4622 / CBS 123669 / FGSC 9596 / NRRL 45880 / 77-13-4) TaxID=660122 RepID=C7YZU3_FUSV7|nr:uncharacterized protein NECHADRAFT_84146 [Fusarium vanettenii 77-13-4]EEU42857.1 hypothetical protein NECHADRAFT_84146 [Fusarium vanettenii 77-13-4]
MKATFFSVFALAISAIASPVPQVNGAVGQVNGVVKSTTDVVTKKVGVKQIVDEATSAKRAIADPQILITTLKTTVHKVNGQTTGINEIVEKVKAGALTKDAAATQAVPIFEAVHFELTEVVTKLTGAAGLNVPDVDVDTVLSLVVVLVSDVLTTVKTLITEIGLRPQLISILHSVFTILAKVLTLVIGIVGAIVPGLLAALTPLLAGLSNAVLAPVLTPITAFLAGIAAA